MDLLRLHWPAPAVLKPSRTRTVGIGGACINRENQKGRFVPVGNWLSALNQVEEIQEIQAPNSPKTEKKQSVEKPPEQYIRAKRKQEEENILAKKARLEIARENPLKTIFDKK